LTYAKYAHTLNIVEQTKPKKETHKNNHDWYSVEQVHIFTEVVA